MKNSYTNPISECDSVSSWSPPYELFFSSFSLNRFIHILWVQRDLWAMPFMNCFIRLKSQRCLPAYWGLVVLLVSKIDAKAEIDGRRNLGYIISSLNYLSLRSFRVSPFRLVRWQPDELQLPITVKECDFCTVKNPKISQMRKQLTSRSLCINST